MAKNYNIREMADAFRGQDYAAQADFGGRYPLVAIKMAALFAKAPEEAYGFCIAMPEYLTGQKLNGAFKDAFLNDGEGAEAEIEDTEVEDTEETETEEKPVKPVKKEKPAPKAEKAEGGVEAMRGELIYKRLSELNLKKDFIEKMGTKKFSKPNMVEYINKYGINIGDDAEPMVYEEEDEKPVKPAKAEKPAKAPKAKPAKKEAEENNDDENLENKTPLQLYDICQKRGIKAKTRQPKEYYLGLLKEAEEQTGGPEDWDDSDVVEELKESKKPAKKAAKKAEPEPVEEADDDDDNWDI